MYHELGLGALVVIGGDGTLAIGHKFFQKGIPVVGVPKTIDNDIVETLNCFGFYTAVEYATDAIDRLHTTAQAHHRVMVLEVMGRYAGWIALYAGMAGGADVILIPEIPFTLERAAEWIVERERRGARFHIVVVAEGAVPAGGRVAVLEEAEAGRVERLGGMGALVSEGLGRLTGKETRSVVLGHLQRGGPPTSFDRILATRLGGKVVECVQTGNFGQMVAFQPPEIVTVPLDQVVGRLKRVPTDSDLVRTARAIGVSFGD
jgi:6-phosphofructokinase 1